MRICEKRACDDVRTKNFPRNAQVEGAVRAALRLVPQRRRTCRQDNACGEVGTRGLSYILIRFDQADQVVKDLFVTGLRDLDVFFAQLQFEYKTQLYRRKSLIILDEIQFFPQARQALKTLLEDGRYDYLGTGSLAGMTKRSKDILIPSEEYTLEVHPLDFEEFLWARADTFTMPLMREHFDSKKPMGALHQSMMRSFREYMLVGGMPQSCRLLSTARTTAHRILKSNRYCCPGKKSCANRKK